MLWNYPEKHKVQSSILLKNEGVLPLEKGTKLFLDGFKNKAAFRDFGEVVATPEEADLL